MALVYVIQVIAYHGGGLKGWRTVRKPSGEAYSFDTYEAAHAALQTHFHNLREDITVRVATMEADTARQVMQVAPTGPTSGQTS